MTRLTQPAFDPTMPYNQGAVTTQRGGFDSRMQYDYCVTLPASSDPIDVKYGVAEIYEWDKTNQRHKVRRPESDSIPSANCVILPGHTLTNTTYDQPITASLYQTRPIIVAYEGDEPEIGDALGTQTDSYALKVGNTGYICMGVVDATEGLCLVRPFASGVRSVLYSGDEHYSADLGSGSINYSWSSSWKTVGLLETTYFKWPASLSINPGGGNFDCSDFRFGIEARLGGAAGVTSFVSGECTIVSGGGMTASINSLKLSGGPYDELRVWLSVSGSGSQTSLQAILYGNVGLAGHTF